MRNILYTRHFNEEIKEEVNVILSPQYYWIKKINVPIKSIKEAKKIAKNIFKLNEKEYYFDAVKINNIYYAIAIRKDLDLKIDKKYIKSLRIAQCEFKDIECLNLPNNFSLQRVDGIFFCFPEHKKNCICVGNLLEKIELSPYNFNIFENLNLSKKELSLIFLSFFMVVFILLGKFFIYKLEENKLNLKYENLKKYNLPLTTIQLNSIIEDYQLKIKKQEKLRKYLILLKNIKLKNNEYIKKMNYQNGILEIVFYTKRNLDNYFKDLKYKSFKKNNYYFIRIYFE